MAHSNWKIENRLNELIDLIKGILDEYGKCHSAVCDKVEIEMRFKGVC